MMNKYPTFLYGAHVRANEIRQHYLRFGGNGVPLVIVPGVASPAALWQHVAQVLGCTFDTYVLDVRGRGLSESGPHLDYGLDACADDLQAFMEALGLSGATLVGHSMGARIGLRLTRRSGHGVQNILMLDPPASAPGRRPYPIPMERSIRMVEAAQRGEGNAYLRAPNVAPWPEHLLRQRAEWLATCDIRAIEVAYRDFHEQDPYEDIALTTAVVSMLVAGGSGVILDEDVKAFANANPRLQVQCLPGAAHQFQVENYAAFMPVLADLLNITLS